VGATPTMGGCQRRRDLRTHLCGFIWLQWSALVKHGGQGDRGDERHDQPQLTVLLDHVEHRDCVWMVEFGRGSCLAHRSPVG